MVLRESASSKYGEFFFDVLRLNFSWTCLLNLSSAHHSLREKGHPCCLSESSFLPEMIYNSECCTSY
jgi:hypothetical protein